MSILSLFWSYDNLFIRDWPEIRKSEILPSDFWPVYGDWNELGTSRNVSNKMFLNTTKFQGYSFCSFWVIKGKPTEGGKITHPPPSLGLKSGVIFFCSKKVSKYFNDFQNHNFYVLGLKWTETIEMKQNYTFFNRAYLTIFPNPFQIWQYFFLICKVVHYLKLIYWQGSSRRLAITVLKEKCISLNLIL